MYIIGGVQIHPLPSHLIASLLSMPKLHVLNEFSYLSYKSQWPFHRKCTRNCGRIVLLVTVNGKFKEHCYLITPVDFADLTLIP